MKPNKKRAEAWCGRDPLAVGPFLHLWGRGGKGLLWGGRGHGGGVGVDPGKERCGCEPNARIIASQSARRFARLAQVPFDFAQGRLSAGKERALQDDNAFLVTVVVAASAWIIFSGPGFAAGPTRW